MRAARVRRALALCCAASALGAGVSACGNPSTSGGSVSGTKLTIYSSLPFDAASSARSTDVLAAERLALKQANAKVGKYAIQLISLNDSAPETLTSDPGQTSQNARAAAESPRTIAYLGDFDSDASKISLPILNRLKILQVTPASAYVGLTQSAGPATEPGEPGKYYPDTTRTFARVVPADNVQAVAASAYMKSLGAHSVFVAADQQEGAMSIAALVQTAAPKQGVRVPVRKQLNTADPSTNADNVAAVKASGADAFFFAGAPGAGAAGLFNALAAADPQLQLFAADTLALPTFVSRLTPATQARTHVTQTPLAPKAYPRAGQQFFADFKAAYGHAPNPYAIYGYEAMSATLAALKSAGKKANNRSEVVKRFFATRNRPSVLGTYSIDTNGDTSSTMYGGYKVASGKLVFDRVLTGKAP